MVDGASGRVNKKIQFAIQDVMDISNFAIMRFSPV